LDTLLLQSIANGIVLGVIYLLMAVGFTLVFGIMRVVNFAHGEFYTLGGYALLSAYTMLKLPYVAALILSVISVGLFGALLERVIFRSFRGSEINGMIASLGIAIMLQSVTLHLFGPSPHSVPSPVSGIFALGPMIFPYSRLYVLAVAVAIFVAFWLAVSYTSIGRAMRASVQDPEIALIQGIAPNRIFPLAFGIGVGLAAAAGALMAPILSISPFVGPTPMLKAFIVVILGGLGSIPGAALGGMLLGLIESISGTIFGATTSDILQLLLVIALLLVRPSGLLGEREMQR
jgi:branched-chain amino acid transport system permease protein